MTKRRIITLVALAIFFGLLLFAATVRSQPSASGDYGAAFFYRNDIWSRDGLVEHFRLDPGVEGSLWQNSSFEIWDGTHATCTDCPTDSIVCMCAGGGDIEPETTFYYDYNTSMRMTTAALFGSVFYLLNTWEENVCYEISFWYMGSTGGEDFGVIVGNLTVTDTYNFATDTFTAPLTAWVDIDIPTTWTRGSVYVVGAVGKTLANDYGVGFYTPNGNGDYVYVDDVRVQRLKTCGVYGTRGNVLSVPVTSDPLWGHSENLLPRTGTGPAYKTGMQLDGVDNYLSCADGVCEMDPDDLPGGGDLSWGCRLAPEEFDGTDIHLVIGKWNTTGNQRAWMLYLNDDGDNWVCAVSKNGSAGAGDYDEAWQGARGIGTTSSVLCTYDQVEDGTSDLIIRTNHAAEGSDLNSVAPIFDSTSDFTIGAYGDAINFYDGTIQECAVWSKPLSLIDRIKWTSPHFPATNYGNGFYVDSCTQVADHSACSTQKCDNGVTTSCRAEGTGVMAIYEGQTEELDNNSYEAVVGDPSAGNFSDWIESGNITAYLADSKHGDVSARMQGGSLTGECIIGGGADTFFEISTKQLNNGGGTIEMWLREYDTGFCSDQLAITTIITCTPGGVYDDCGALFEAATWNALTSSYKIQIIDSVDGDMLIDCVSIKEASYHTPWVHCPTGSGSVSYNSRQYDLHNPLSDYCQSEGAGCYASGFCISIWVYSDFDPTDGNVRYIVYVGDAPGGGTNRWNIRKDGSNRITFDLFDSAAANKLVRLTLDTTNWAIGDWKYIQACSDNAGVISASHYNEANSTWYDWTDTAGVGTGIQNDQATEITIGSANNANYCDCYYSEIHISPYNVIDPNAGFNNGRAPVNDGAPY